MSTPVDTGTGRRPDAEADASAEVATADVIAFPGTRPESLAPEAPTAAPTSAPADEAAGEGDGIEPAADAAIGDVVAATETPSEHGAGETEATAPGAAACASTTTMDVDAPARAEPAAGEPAGADAARPDGASSEVAPAALAPSGAAVIEAAVVGSLIVGSSIVEPAIEAADTATAAATVSSPEPEPPPAPAPEPVVAPPTPGERLRAARDARQLGVQQVTDSLHIEPRLIAAMESDDFAAFDAPVYARGFLRKYAAFLDVPADEVLAAYERLHAGPVAPSLVPTTSADVPRRDWSAFKLPALVAGVLVLVGGAYWWWQTRAPAEPASPATQTAAPPAANANDAAPALPISAPASESGGAATTPDSTVTPSVTGSAAPGPAVAPTARTPVSAANPGYAPPPAAPTGAALEIQFVADCWVDATGPTGRNLMYGLGRAGESRVLSGPGPWRVTLGNVAGVRLRVAGRPVSVPAARRTGDTARLVVGADATVQ
jgi:cytoskeleton protein RodZ